MALCRRNTGDPGTSQTRRMKKHRDPKRGGERLGIHSAGVRERGPVPTILTYHICWDRKLPQKRTKGERERENQIFKLKGMREGAKAEAGAGVPGFEGRKELDA